MSTVDEALASSPLFRAVTAVDRARLAAVCAVKSYEKGDVIFSEGDPSEFLFTIVEWR